jgi:hypothetical protein
VAVVVGGLGGELVEIVYLDAGFFERRSDNGGSVGTVAVEGLASPQPRHEDTAATEPEVLTIMGLRSAVARSHTGGGSPGLDAVVQPVRALRHARQPPDLFCQTVDVTGTRRRAVVGIAVGVGDRLGEVLAELADAPVGLGSAGDEALHVDLGAEAHHVGGSCLRVGVELVERLTPGRKGLAGFGVDVAARVVGPLGQPVDVNRLVVRRPPDLVVGGGHDLADDLAGDDAADRGVQVGREAALGFDDREVLSPVAGGAAQVLPEPVDELGEVHGIERGAELGLLDQGRRSAPPRPALFAGLLPSARPSAPAARATSSTRLVRQRTSAAVASSLRPLCPRDTNVQPPQIDPGLSAVPPAVLLRCPASAPQEGCQGHSSGGALHFDSPPPAQGSAATRKEDGCGVHPRPRAGD